MKQAIKIAAALAIAIGFSATLRPVDAHHSMVMYDRLKSVTLNCTVV